MPTSSCPSGRLEPPMTTMGQGTEMPRVPCTPRASKAMSHTVERCRCRPSGPGGTFSVQAGSGCLGARVTRSKGGVEVGGVQVLAGRHGDDHLPHGMPRTRAGLAMAPCNASGAPRAVTKLAAALARGPSLPVRPGGSLCCSGSCTRGRGLNRRRLWCRMSGNHARNGTYKQGEGCKAPMENGGAKMEQCNNKTNELDEIHRNSHEIWTNFVRISQCLNIETHLFT